MFFASSAGQLTQVVHIMYRSEPTEAATILSKLDSDGT